MIKQAAHPGSIASIGLPVLLILAGATVFGSPAHAQAMCLSATTVNTESELNDAINCFNMATPAVEHIVTFGADIDLASTTPLNEITRSDPSSELTLQAVGVESIVTGNGSRPTTPAEPILIISGENPVTLRNLRLRAAPGAAVHVLGSAPIVTLEDVTLFDNGTGLLMQASYVRMTVLKDRLWQHRKSRLAVQVVAVAWAFRFCSCC